MRFRDLDELPEQGGDDGADKWPLDEWYDRVREIEITELSPGDLAVACRQNAWPEHTVPAAIAALRRNAYAGELYDGELIVSLSCLPEDFWRANIHLAHEAKTLIDSLPADSVPSNVTEALVVLQSSLGRACRR